MSTTNENENTADNRYMEFRLGDQLFALPLLLVKEVIQRPDVTAVPNMPTHFEGMMNLRGQILGVFNVRKKLSAKPKDSKLTTADVIVVIEQDGVSVGMIVDEVTRVIHPNNSQIRPAPLKEDDPAGQYVGAVIQVDQLLVLTVNIQRLLELAKYKLEQKAA